MTANFLLTHCFFLEWVFPTLKGKERKGKAGLGSGWWETGPTDPVWVRKACISQERGQAVGSRELGQSRAPAALGEAAVPRLGLL